MNKKISYIVVFILMISFVSLKVKAVDSCSYSNPSAKYDSSDSGIYYEFKVSEGGSGHSIHSKNNKTTNEESILNWDKEKAIPNFTGENYIKTNNACPPYLFVLYSASFWDLGINRYSVLLSDKSYNESESYIKKEYARDPDQYWILKPVENSSDSDKEVSNNQQNEDSSQSCLDFKQETAGGYGCIDNHKFSCLWISGGDSPGYCNVDDLQYVKCGGAFDIPEQAPRIMSYAINLLKIGTPIILIITGMITLVKALAASKEDDMKKAQSALIRKAIAAAFVFFVISIVQFVLLSVADSGDESSITTCLSCFMNNDCDSNVYFKTKVGSEYQCHLVSSPSTSITCGENE